MLVEGFREERVVNAMITLLILATIGAVAGGLGGAFTNGVDGFILGGCAGFVLGVVAWITDSMAEQRVQELHPDQILREFDRATPPLYEQPVSRQQQTDHIHSS